MVGIGHTRCTQCPWQVPRAVSRGGPDAWAGYVSRTRRRWRGFSLPSAGRTFVLATFMRKVASGLAFIAGQTPNCIADQYAIESEIRGLDADERHAVRRERSKPIVEALRACLKSTIIQKMAHPLRVSRREGLRLVRRIAVAKSTWTSQSAPVYLSRSRDSSVSGTSTGPSPYRDGQMAISIRRPPSPLTKIVNSPIHGQRGELVP